MTSVSEHYRGERGAAYQHHLANADFYRRQQVQLYFQGQTSPDDVVVDFGCNDGLFLALVDGKRKIGIEVNAAAREQCVSEDIEMLADPTEVPDGIADVVISNHCLEHTLSPLAALDDIHRMLRPGGKLVLVLPFDDWRSKIHRRWRSDDPDNHLFTWSPMNLGNLLTEAGFRIEKVEHTRYAISNRFEPVYNLFGRRGLLFAAHVFSRYRRRTETFAIAFKP